MSCISVDQDRDPIDRIGTKYMGRKYNLLPYYGTLQIAI
jgi:hypothetical protein